MGKIRITGMNSGLDTDAMVRELVNAYEKQGAKYTKAKTKTEWKQEAWTVLNGKIKNFFSKYASNMRFSSEYNKKKTTVSDSSKATIITGEKAVNGTQTLKINALAKSGYLTGGELKTDASGNAVTGKTTLADMGVDFGETDKINFKFSVGGKEKSFEVDKNMTLNEFANTLNSQSTLTASFDETNGRFFVSSNESGAKNNFEFTNTDGIGSLIQEKLRLNDEPRGTEGGAVKVTGDDAEIELNGATFKSANNTFSINGLTITAKAVSDEMSVVTDTDYDEIYDSIKNFFKEYNSLMNEMDKLYNAKSSKGFEPLTSEEKDAMTDDEIEKWEARIKDALLRQDSELDTVASAMRGAMLSTFKIGGETYSLSSFGINTMGYFEAPDNEKNAYHIDGDKDDPNSSGNPDKLKAMIASNPSATASFFQKLSGKLYDAMNKISSRSDNYKSFGNFFSDKKITSEIVDQTKQVDKWEKYVADQEDKYYKQFTAMESAMSSLNSQQSYISQLFAG